MILALPRWSVSPLSRGAVIGALGLTALAMLGRHIPTARIAAAAQPDAAPEVQERRDSVELRVEPFGRLPDGRDVECYTLRNARGMRVRVMTFGATLLTVEAPDRHGRSDHVALYLDTLDDYVKGHPLFGSIVGRYANRIAGARFTLDGRAYRLEANAGEHHIHGGKHGFQNQLWRAKPLPGAGSAGVELSLESPDGEGGYPGNVEVAVTYRLNDRNELWIEYAATTDKPTPLNLTNHVYWNLAGAGSGDVLGHELTLRASHFLPTDAKKIPTGEIRSVEGTPMDFRQGAALGSRIDQVEGANYDHCYVLDQPGGNEPALCARLVEPRSGRVLEVLTTKPGVQLYTAKGLSDRLRGGGKPYGAYHGVCLETQFFPDAPNQPRFPSPVLRPGQTYRHATVFRFGAT